MESNCKPQLYKTDEEKEQIAAGLAPILDLDEQEVLEKLQKKHIM